VKQLPAIAAMPVADASAPAEPAISVAPAEKPPQTIEDILNRLASTGPQTSSTP
jgi:hypothetical protein